MTRSLTLEGARWRRFLSFIAGAGMVTASWMTIKHFYDANFPESIFKGAFCDISKFFNCDSSAYSAIAQVAGVPLGYFGLFVGALVVLGALFPSRAFERTNKSLALANVLGVLALFGYSVFALKSLCLLCTGFYVFSLFSFVLFWKYGHQDEREPKLLSFFGFSFKHALVWALLLVAGAAGVQQYTAARKDAQLGGVATRVVKQYYSLAKIPNPSLISPFWTAKATEAFDAAPIRVIEYVDFRCPDCLFLYEQLKRLKEEYKGKINIAFQFFPLETACNKVVTKNLHPGACDLSFMAAADPAKFLAIHDEIFENFQKGKDPAWRAALAKKHGVESALTDPAVQDLVGRIIATGAEYEKTSDKYLYGIRSTPTMIINNRLVIGTLPYAHLKAIFQSLLDESQAPADERFIENWVDLKN
jgi:uncharacterized membrane protein/protein-disulfide isomerase